MTSSAGSEREDVLDGLRGLAILLVLVFHGFVQVYTSPDISVLVKVKQVLGVTGMGVDLFFVLSGFLIGRILLRTRGAGNFYRVFYVRRACRILPVYWLLLASFVAAAFVPVLVEVGGPAYFSTKIPFWSYVVFWHNNLMATLRDIGPWWLVPAWSLAVEEQFYLFAPWLVRNVSRRILFLVAALFLIVGPLGRFFSLTSAHNFFAAIYLTPLRLDAIMTGVILAALSEEDAFAAAVRKSRYVLVAVLAGAVGLCLLPLVRPITSPIPALIWGPSCAALAFGSLLLWARYFPGSPGSRMLTWGWLRQLGHLSYFIYLFHLPLIYTLHAVVRHGLPAHLQWTDSLATVTALVLAIALAILSRRWLEGPLIRFGHRFQYSS